MNGLLTRDEFRKGVFERDDHVCVICGSAAQDAHHIIERRLFEDGGYYIQNGASLCGGCHLKAENTTISPDEIREAAGIEKTVLPGHLYPDYQYDKWGNIVNPSGTRIKGELFFDESVQKVLKAGGVLDRFLPYVKYPRTPHLNFSPGRTKDDRVLKDNSIFEDKEVVATIKMDGENTTGYYDGYVHARSTDSDNHPSRNWVKNYLSNVLYHLPFGWRICGENLYAKHSIHYKTLQSYFNAFSLWDASNNCLSWTETEEYFALLGLVSTPVVYRGIWDKEKVMKAYLTYKNSQFCGGEHTEGFVVRIAERFTYGQFRNSVAKYVRADHVQQNTHWVRGPIIKNGLVTENR
jgi:hypothetical protein